MTASRQLPAYLFVILSLCRGSSGRDARHRPPVLIFVRRRRDLSLGCRLRCADWWRALAAETVRSPDCISSPRRGCRSYYNLLVSRGLRGDGRAVVGQEGSLRVWYERTSREGGGAPPAGPASYGIKSILVRRSCPRAVAFAPRRDVLFGILIAGKLCVGISRRIDTAVLI